VTVGSAVKGIEFTRLIKKMDEIAGKIEEEVVMQIGTVPYEPKNAQYFRYASYQANLPYFQQASLVVGHAGTGTILNALKFKTPIIVVPRRHRYGEHVDDHQVELARKMEQIPGIYVVYEIEALESMIKKALDRATIERRKELFAERGKLLQTIRDFVERCA
jgi:beta-1,4-N-acetylglucosaminyltransferase